MQKAVQSRVLSLLSTRWGVLLASIGAVWCILSAVGLLSALIGRIGQHSLRATEAQMASSQSRTPSTFLCNPLTLCSAVRVLVVSLWCAVLLSSSVGSSRAAVSSAECCGGLSDNLAGLDFRDRLCLPAIDVVYTWVNGSDPKLQRELAHYKRLHDADKAAQLAALAPPAIADTLNRVALNINATRPVAAVNASSGADNVTNDQFGANRFRDNSELRYSLRSLWRFAPWVRHVFIVTNGQVPHWLNLDHPRLTLVSHSDIYPNRSHLPTFSSPSIESHLHRIPGLADLFVYFNDDVLLGNDVWPDDFLGARGAHKVYLSWNVPNCAQGCPQNWISDGYCDAACNNAACTWDGGDCANSTLAETAVRSWDERRPKSSALASKYCSTGCPNSWVGDKVCDRSCKVSECAFDGGDCGVELVQQHLPELRLEADDQWRLRSFEVGYDTVSLYVNLSAVLPAGILEASHDNTQLVRSAIVTQSLHILTLVLFREEDIQQPQPQQAPTASSTDAIPDKLSSMSVAELAASSYLVPGRTVEIYLAGEAADGRPVNVTFNVTRSRIPPTWNADDSAETTNETMQQQKERDVAAMKEEDNKRTQQEKGAEQSEQKAEDSRLPEGEGEAAADGDDEAASSLWPTVRKLLSIDTLTQPISRIASLFSSPDEHDTTDASPGIPFSASTRSSTAFSSAVAYSLAASSRSWSEYSEVVVDGIPLSSSRHTGVKLRRTQHSSLSLGSPSHSLVSTDDGGFALLSHYEAGRARLGYMIASGGVVEMYGWTDEDAEVAARIEVLKRKELWWADHMTAREAMRRAVRERRESREKAEQRQWSEGEQAVIWPWELGIDNSDMWGDAWSYIENTRDKDSVEQLTESEEAMLADGLTTMDDSWMQHRLSHFAATTPQQQRLPSRDADIADRAPSDSLSSDVDGIASHFTPARRHVHFHSDDSSTGLAANLFHRPSPHSSSSDSDSTPLFSPSNPNDQLNSTFSSRLHPLVNPNGRHLLDLYGDSLRHVNDLFNAKYGKETRKAPAHMPHCFNKRVMAELQSRWSEQYDATSSHRFRDARDMQLAFSYYYYVMNEPAPLELQRLWTDKLDWDGDGQLSEQEIRHMAVYIAGKKCAEADIATFRRLLYNYTSAATGHRVTLDTLQRAPDVLEALDARGRKQKKYRHELMALDDVQFYMVSDNASKVSQRLDELRVQMPKFICLNDDMNKTDVEAGRLSGSAAVLREFYDSYFPHPCPFELEEGKTNGFQYVEEWSGRARWLASVSGVEDGWWVGVCWLLWMLVAIVVGGLAGVLLWWWFQRRSSVSGVLDRRRMRVNGHDGRAGTGIVNHAFARTSTIV